MDISENQLDFRQSETDTNRRVSLGPTYPGPWIRPVLRIHRNPIVSVQCINLPIQGLLLKPHSSAGANPPLLVQSHQCDPSHLSSCGRVRFVPRMHGRENHSKARLEQ